MPKTFRLPGQEPLFDLVSYGRGGAGRLDRLTPAQIAYIRRTVNRAPEVMVKVLPRASNDLSAVGKHLDYISRHGKLELETDDATRLAGGSKALLDDWDLDIDETRRRTKLTSTKGGQAPKLVHKLMFSMSAGTPPEKVLDAARNFAREQFWGQHRYALVLHTDEPHPHVHLVLKAVSEQGERLNIKKATLRLWRAEFARHLRVIGVAANATERAVRGQTQKAPKDGIYRSSLRGDSTYIRRQAEAVASEMLRGNLRADSGKRTLLETRKTVRAGWSSIADRLTKEGHQDTARDVMRFIERMPAVRTEREQLAILLIEKAKTARTRDQQRTR